MATPLRPLLRLITKPTLSRPLQQSLTLNLNRNITIQATLSKAKRPSFQSFTKTRTYPGSQQRPRFNSNTSNTNANAKTNGPKQGQSNAHSHGQGQAKSEPSGLSARLKKLTREYGWAALGVYLTLSALDFPFCFAAVRLLGVERIGHFEHVILGYVKGVLGPVWPWKNSEGENGSGGNSAIESGSDSGSSSEAGAESASDAVLETKNGEASIWTQLVFAYAIHKSLLIFVRVPLTAAVTPKVVKVLRGWGWDIGKRAK